MTPEHRKLNINCGYRKIDDHWNVDSNVNCNPNQVVDLNQFPWPFEDDFFERITAFNVMNHIGRDNNDFGRVMQEIYRVSSADAELFVSIPHPRSDGSLDDYKQVRTLTPKTFMLFDQKRNFESLAKKAGEPIYGFELGVDFEIKDVQPILSQYWDEQLKSGMVGQKQLEINMFTMNNVLDGFNLFIKVHKPQRFEDWYRTQKK